jgi:hypothetical protein
MTARRFPRDGAPWQYDQQSWMTSVAPCLQAGVTPGDVHVRQIEASEPLASRVSDQTTVGRLLAFVEDVKQRLRQRGAARRIREEIKARAQEIWEQNGPDGRDLEFWLQAETEINVRSRE